MNHSNLDLYVQQRITEFKAGADFWRTYEKDHQLTCKDFVVALVSDNEEINRYSLKYLSALKKEKDANHIFLLSSDPNSKQLAQKYAACEYQIQIVPHSDIMNLCLLFSIYRFSEQLIINTYKNTADNDATELIGTAGITVQDIVAVSMFGLSKVPDENSLAISNPSIPSQCFKAIDWNAPENATYIVQKEYVDFEIFMKDAFSYVMKQGKITKHNKIILFGATTASMYIMDFLEGYDIVAILDNNERKIGDSIRGIKIYRPEDFLSTYDANYRIFVSSQYYKPMCEQLYGLGYALNEQVFVSYFAGAQWNVLPETINIYTDWAEQGLNIYKQISELYPQRTLLLCPYTGSGDIYLIGLYIKKYTETKKIKKYILVVVSNSCKKIASLFDMDAHVIGDVEMRRLHKFARMSNFANGNIHIMNDCFDQAIIGRLRGYKELDFNTMFQKVVFHQEEKAPNIVPYQKAADAFFEEYHLQKGKTILISPYANTAAKIEDSVWIALVKKLKAKGYDIVTNIGSDAEIPLPLTIGLFIPYNQIIDFLNKAGGFIGLRSGLCDIVSTTTAKMCVLYPEGTLFMNASTYDYFSLKRMKLRAENLLEIEFRTDNQLECCDEISKNF